MSINQSLNKFFEKHKALVIIFTTAFSGFLGWGLNSQYGALPKERIQEAIKQDPSIVNKPEDWLKNPNSPLLYDLEIENETLICGFDPFVMYERVVLLEIEYLGFLISTGHHARLKVDLNEKSKELNQIRKYCLDNDPETDNEKKERHKKDSDFRWRMYELSKGIKELQSSSP